MIDQVAVTGGETETAEAAGSSDRRGLYSPPARLALRADEVHGDTMCGIALRQVERLGDRVALEVKRGSDWLPVSWAETRDAYVSVGAALIHAGVRQGERVAILSENRIEWLCADFGGQFAGAAIVPIYASSSPETVGEVLRDSGAVAVICSKEKQVAKVEEVADRLPELRTKVIIEGAARGWVSLADLVSAARSDDVAELCTRLRAIQPDDIITIIYTSGTTGVPKGVVLTHANVVGSCRSILDVVRLREDDHGITFLPWAHVYERVQGIFAGVYAGVTASIANDLEHVGEDLRAVRPTLMNGVPRMYEKIQEAILAQIRSAGGGRTALGLRALHDATELARLQRRSKSVPLALRLRCRLWERLVLRRVREGLGGRARIFSSGGGPINMATLEFFDALGIAILEGYGLTETSGGVTANLPEAPRFGTVGKATPGHEVRIAPDGEILVRGPGVMRGYFNADEATDEVLHSGWLATGDIGELEDGFLRITDRKKDLIVTAGGKNVAPQPIEAALMHDPLVERATVIGDRRKYLVALIVPNVSALEQWARENGVSATSPAELAKDAKVIDHYTKLAEQVSARLARYETIKKVAVLDRDLEESRGELTPTLKVKRSVVAKNFADVIEALYD
jgi:long-chain acyl-CoA synthetase